MISMSGRIVVITGGSRGIGRAAALLFAKAGADVLISYYKDERAATSVLSEIRGTGHRALAVRGNIAEDSHCRDIIDTALREFGKIDVLVNNAGIWIPAAIDEMPEAIWRQTLEINLTGAMSCTRYAVRQMKRQKSGRIIMVSSSSGQVGEAFYSHYAATKGALISLTKSLAAELAPDILVNCVAPWWVETDLVAASLSDPSVQAQIRKENPLRRAATPDEIAAAILFLASDLASFITGEILNVNGGSDLIG